MKTLLAVLAVAAFALVLLAKPFEFLERYSVHAGHALYAVQTDTDLENPGIDERLTIELNKASAESPGFRFGFWFSTLGVLGLCILVLSFKRKTRLSRKQGLV